MQLAGAPLGCGDVDQFGASATTRPKLRCWLRSLHFVSQNTDVTPLTGMHPFSQVSCRLLSKLYQQFWLADCAMHGYARRPPLHFDCERCCRSVRSSRRIVAHSDMLRRCHTTCARIAAACRMPTCASIVKRSVRECASSCVCLPSQHIGCRTEQNTGRSPPPPPPPLSLPPTHPRHVVTLPSTCT